MIIKRKFFGDIATGVGLVVGLGGGAYLGNKLHAKYDYIKAKRKFDPEKSAEKKRKRG